VGGVVIRDVDPRVDVNRVGWQVEPWDWINEHGVRIVAGENIPINLGDAVACLPTVDGSELERAVEVSVRMGEIDPTAEWDQVGASRVTFRRVGRPDEVRRRRGSRCMDVAWGMVLKPVALIDGVIADVGVVEGVKFDEEATVLEA
jgi:hypothetical protein